MFREMRRKDRRMDEAACLDILGKGTTGVLAVHGDDGYPYAIPLNYIYEDGKIYFHAAKAGHKIDAITRDSKVSFCVVGMERTVPEKFTTDFKSVVVFGRAAIVEDEIEKREAIKKLADRFSPDEPHENRDAEIARGWKSFVMIRIDIVHMTGKQAVEPVSSE